MSSSGNPFLDPTVGNPQGGGNDQNPFISNDNGSGAPPPQNIPWSQVPTQMIEHAPGSAWNLVSSIYHSVRHPVDTATGLYNTGTGAMEELYNLSPVKTPEEQQFDAVKQYYMDRYGSLNGFKQALATDPMGVISDASGVIGGAGAAIKTASAAGKVAGLTDAASAIGKAGDVVNAASKAINPIALAGKAASTIAKPVGKFAANAIGTAGTFTGERPVELAFQAGQLGGQAGQDFNNFINNRVPPQNMVATARNAVQAMRAAKNAEYQSGMAGIAADTERQQWENKATQLQYNARANDVGLPEQPSPAPMMSFDPVDKKLTEINNLGNFQGIDIDPASADAREKISEAISNWKNKDPATFHTPMGFDALKQQLYSIADTYQPGTRGRLYADKAAGAVKDSIIQQAPQYAKVMGSYWQASDLLRQIESDLSLKPGANVGTAMRKLQSVMRNNVNTNYGYRQSLVDALTPYGAQTLPYQLAGHALNSWTPRGLGPYEMAAAGIESLAKGSPAPLAILPFMSPKLVGKAAYALGAMSRSKLPGRVLPQLNYLSATQRPMSYLPGYNQ